MTTFYFELNTLKPQEQIYQLPTRVGDNNTTMEVTIMNGDDPYDFTGKYLEFAMVRPDREWVHLKECVTQVHDNVWSCTLPPEALAVAGIANLAYFVVRDEEDGRFRDSTQRIQILIDDSATGNVKIGPYSDQVDALIQTVYSLTLGMEKLTQDQERQLQDALEAMRKTYREAEDKRDEAARTAEESRQQTFDAAEEERKRIYDAAVKLLNSELGDLDAINAFYLESNWKDTETGFVSTQKFTEFKTGLDETYVRTDQKNQEGGYMEYVPYLEDGAFREAVAGGWPVYE